MDAPAGFAGRAMLSRQRLGGLAGSGREIPHLASMLLRLAREDSFFSISSGSATCVAADALNALTACSRG